MGFAVVICHFFRKFCQDDDEVDDEYNKQEDMKASKEELAWANLRY